MTALAHPELLPEPDLLPAPNPVPPARPPACQCECRGWWKPEGQFLSCGCPPCPNPPADREEDQRCQPCRDWKHEGKGSPHHTTAHPGDWTQANPYWYEQPQPQPMYDESPPLPMYARPPLLSRDVTRNLTRADGYMAMVR